MDVEVSRGLFVDAVEKPAELDGTVAAVELPDDAAGGHVERRKQCCRPIPSVVVGSPLGEARSEG